MSGHCALCGNDSRMASAGGIAVMPDGRRVVYTLCPACTARIERATQIERAELREQIDLRIANPRGRA